jgi:hypothetical protein
MEIPFELLGVMDDLTKDQWLVSSIFFVTTPASVQTGLFANFIEAMKLAIEETPSLFEPYIGEARKNIPVLKANPCGCGDSELCTSERTLEIFEVISGAGEPDKEYPMRDSFESNMKAAALLEQSYGDKVSLLYFDAILIEPDSLRG